MSIGKTIKRIRNMRGLTQKELGLAIGFDDNTADVRVAQYEMGNRVPKEEMLKNIANVLHVNYKFLNISELSDTEELIYTLLHLEDNSNIEFRTFEHPTASGKTIRYIGTILNDNELCEFSEEWSNRKDKMTLGKITKDEYDEWKMKWSYENYKNSKRRYKLTL